MRELTEEEKECLVTYCMKPKNTRLALAIGHIQQLREKTVPSFLMRALTPEEEKYLEKYCMESKENTRLALAIGHIQLQLREKILSSFLKKLDESDEGELNTRNCQWQTCIPTANLQVGDKDSWSLLTMQKQGIKIHLARYKWQSLFVGTPKSNAANWPNGALKSFKELVGRRLHTRNNNWLWWFNPTEDHRCIRSIEALSTLNSSQKIKYFTAELVCFAEAISKALEAQE